MKEQDESLLLGIKDEAGYLLEKVKDHDLYDFLKDRDLQYIVTLALIKIGENVKSLSKELKQENQEIKWRDITALRNIAVHNYEGLRMSDIWGNVRRDVPELLERVNAILLAEGVEDRE